MSMISEQVEELRRCAALYDRSPYGRETKRTKELLRRAADTIEALSEKVRVSNKADAEKSRAVKIAAGMMVAAGLCLHEDAAKCRKTYVSDDICEKCIMGWLLRKARKELG